MAPTVAASVNEVAAGKPKAFEVTRALRFIGRLASRLHQSNVPTNSFVKSPAALEKILQDALGDLPHGILRQTVEANPSRFAQALATRIRTLRASGPPQAGTGQQLRVAEQEHASGQGRLAAAGKGSAAPSQLSVALQSDLLADADYVKATSAAVGAVSSGAVGAYKMQQARAPAVLGTAGSRKKGQVTGGMLSMAAAAAADDIAAAETALQACKLATAGVQEFSAVVSLFAPALSPIMQAASSLGEALRDAAAADPGAAEILGSGLSSHAERGGGGGGGSGRKELRALLQRLRVLTIDLCSLIAVRYEASRGLEAEERGRGKAPGVSCWPPSPPPSPDLHALATGSAGGTLRKSLHHIWLCFPNGSGAASERPAAGRLAELARQVAALAVVLKLAAEVLAHRHRGRKGAPDGAPAGSWGGDDATRGLLKQMALDLVAGVAPSSAEELLDLLLSQRAIPALQLPSADAAVLQGVLSEAVFLDRKLKASVGLGPPGGGNGQGAGQVAQGQLYIKYIAVAREAITLFRSAGERSRASAISAAAQELPVPPTLPAHLSALRASGTLPAGTRLPPGSILANARALSDWLLRIVDASLFATILQSVSAAEGVGGAPSAGGAEAVDFHVDRKQQQQLQQGQSPALAKGAVPVAGEEQLPAPSLEGDAELFFVDTKRGAVAGGGGAAGKQEGAGDETDAFAAAAISMRASQTPKSLRKKRRKEQEEEEEAGLGAEISYEARRTRLEGAAVGTLSNKRPKGGGGGAKKGGQLDIGGADGKANSDTDSGSSSSSDSDSLGHPGGRRRLEVKFSSDEDDSGDEDEAAAEAKEEGDRGGEVGEEQVEAGLAEEPEEEEETPGVAAKLAAEEDDAAMDEGGDGDDGDDGEAEGEEVQKQPLQESQEEEAEEAVPNSKGTPRGTPRSVKKAQPGRSHGGQPESPGGKSAGAAVAAAETAAAEEGAAALEEELSPLHTRSGAVVKAPTPVASVKASPLRTPPGKPALTPKKTPKKAAALPKTPKPAKATAEAEEEEERLEALAQAQEPVVKSTPRLSAKGGAARRKTPGTKAKGAAAVAAEGAAAAAEAAEAGDGGTAVNRLRMDAAAGGEEGRDISPLHTRSGRIVLGSPLRAASTPAASAAKRPQGLPPKSALKSAKKGAKSEGEGVAALQAAAAAAPEAAEEGDNHEGTGAGGSGGGTVSKRARQGLPPMSTVKTGRRGGGTAAGGAGGRGAPSEDLFGADENEGRSTAGAGLGSSSGNAPTTPGLRGDAGKKNDAMASAADVDDGSGGGHGGDGVGGGGGEDAAKGPRSHKKAKGGKKGGEHPGGDGGDGEEEFVSPLHTRSGRVVGVGAATPSSAAAKRKNR
eukprot:jgi/Mesen1/4685/ME000241S03731